MNYIMKDINNLYTEIVKNYIDEGYNIYTEPMDGSQGEIAKIFLECNNNIICIYMKEFHDYCDFIDGIFIIVGTFDRFKAYDNINDTIWLNELNCISTYRYFEISKHKYYTDYYKFALSCRNKHIERFNNRTRFNRKKFFNSNEFKEFAYNKCKKTKGYKNVRKRDIKGIIKRYGDYFARIDGKYALKLNNQSLNYNIENEK